MRRALVFVFVISGFTPTQLAERFAAVERELAPVTRTEDAFRLLTRVATRDVPGAEYAGISQGRQARFRTVAATDEVVERTDQIQYEMGTGPCVDAIVKDTVLVANDLANDQRWPQFGRRAFETTGIASMLSFRLFFENPQGVTAGLNMYARRRDAFNERSRAIGLILATHGALAVSTALARDKADNLERALRTSREIGIAMGVLMHQHKITREQAFDLLRVASQHTHRKLADIATDVADTGHLELPSPRRSRPSLRAST